MIREHHFSTHTDLNADYRQNRTGDSIPPTTSILLMKRVSRRAVLISGAIGTALGAGVTVDEASNNLDGDASVQADQALELNDVTTSSGDTDASFTRVSDDDTTFGAAVELNNGDSVEINVNISNSSFAAIKTQATIETPSDLSVSARIADDDDLQGDNEVVQTGDGKYVFTVPGRREVRFITTLSVPDTASSSASDVELAFSPLSTEENDPESQEQDEGPVIRDAKLIDENDEDGVVSDGETVRLEATVTEFNGLESVTTETNAFDPVEQTPIELTDDGPNVLKSDDKFSTRFEVGERATEGNDQTVEIEAVDNEGVNNIESGDSLVIKDIEVDNDAPNVSAVGLEANPDDASTGDGIVKGDDDDNVVRDGEQVKVSTTVSDAETSQEITRIIADASDFGAGDVVLYESDEGGDNFDGGGTLKEFTVGEDDDANEGIGQTITLRVVDENNDATIVRPHVRNKDTISLSEDDFSDVDVQLVIPDTSEVKLVDASGDNVTDSNGRSVNPVSQSTGELELEDPYGTVSVSSLSDEGVTETDPDNTDKPGRLEVHNDGPTISSVELTHKNGGDGVVSDDEEVTVKAKVETAETADEITKVTADASEFGAGEEITLNDSDTSDANEADAGGKKEVSKTFEVGKESRDGTGKTVTVTAEDEHGNSSIKESNSLEIYNTPTISSIELRDPNGGDRVVESEETVKVRIKAQGTKSTNAIGITSVKIETQDFGAGTKTINKKSNLNLDGTEPIVEFTVGSDSSAVSGDDKPVKVKVTDNNSNSKKVSSENRGEDGGGTLDINTNSSSTNIVTVTMS